MKIFNIMVTQIDSRGHVHCDRGGVDNLPFVCSSFLDEDDIYRCPDCPVVILYNRIVDSKRNGQS